MCSFWRRSSGAGSCNCNCSRVSQLIWVNTSQGRPAPPAATAGRQQSPAGQRRHTWTQPHKAEAPRTAAAVDQLLLLPAAFACSSAEQSTTCKSASSQRHTTTIPLPPHPLHHHHASASVQLCPTIGCLDHAIRTATTIATPPRPRPALYHCLPPTASFPRTSALHCTALHVTRRNIG